MPRWQQLIAAAGLAMLAPTLAWLGKRLATRTKGGVMLASLMFGLGEVLDPPAKRGIEATERKKGSPDNGEPLLD